MFISFLFIAFEFSSCMAHCGARDLIGQLLELLLLINVIRIYQTTLFFRDPYFCIGFTVYYRKTRRLRIQRRRDKGLERGERKEERDGEKDTLAVLASDSEFSFPPVALLFQLPFAAAAVVKKIRYRVCEISGAFFAGHLRAFFLPWRLGCFIFTTREEGRGWREREKLLPSAGTLHYRKFPSAKNISPQNDRVVFVFQTPLVHAGITAAYFGGRLIISPQEFLGSAKAKRTAGDFCRFLLGLKFRGEKWYLHGKKLPQEKILASEGGGRREY